MHVLSVYNYHYQQKIAPNSTCAIILRPWVTALKQINVHAWLLSLSKLSPSFPALIHLDIVYVSACMCMSIASYIAS